MDFTMSSEFQPPHFCHEEKEEAVMNEEESEELCDVNVSSQEGSSEVLEEGLKKVKGRKTKSSGDVRNDDVTNATNSSLPSSPVFTTTPVIPTSPPLSRRKRLFNSLRNRTRRLRGKTRDKDATGEFPPDPICTTDEEGVSHDTQSLAVSGRKSEIVRPVGINDGFVTTITTNKTNALKKQANEDTEMATVPNDETEKEESGEIEEGIAVVEKPSLDVQEEEDEYSSIGGSIEPSSSFSQKSLDHRYLQDTEEGEINELSEPERDDAALASYVSSHSLDASQSGNLSMKIMYASEYDFEDDSDDNYDGDDDDDDFEDWSIIHKRLDEAYSETKTTLATERMTVIDDYTTESDTDISVFPAVSVKNVKDGNLQQRQNALMEHSFFMLEVRLKEGRDLVVRDSCGTSDPYVKFKLGGRVVYKSRIIFKNLNPKWDETFTIPLSNISKPILVKVFDYDRGFHDDPMGTSVIDMSQLELGKPTELKLMLSDRGKSDYMGYLLLTCSLIPKTQEEKEQYYNQKSVRKVDPSKKLKMQQWSSVVTILLVDGKDLVPMDDNGLSDPYVKFKLGNEKYRSKHKNKTLNPRWLEQFDLRLYEDQPNILEINVYDYDVTAKDDFMGRAVINLAELEQEVTHTLNVELEDGAGVLKLMLTISGSAGQESASGLCNFTPSLRQHNEIRRRYSIMKSFSQMEDVGFLQVKVFKAEDLKGADLSGLSDPFCVLELVNSRVQTHTEFKTLNPEWNKIFTFKLKDIHSALDITVYDADRSGKFEFLGRVAIPLLKITSGERKWYSLKDKKLVHRSKGAILLEMDLVFNPIKAAIRTVNPTEQKIMQLEPKFRINVMKTNIERVSKLVNSVIEIGQFLKSCFNWESKPRSATAFLVFLIMVWNFELYLLPVSLLLLFLKNLIIAHLIGAFKRESIEDVKLDEDEDEDDEDKEKEEKKSFKERLQSIQDVCLQVQQGMDEVASLGERIKNTFNWSVPWLSTLAVIVLSVAAIILYLVPLRIIVLIWGINKFTKKLRQPKAINNNEVLDFLSRVPCDREVIEYRELKLDIPSSNKKKRS